MKQEKNASIRELKLKNKNYHYYDLQAYAQSISQDIKHLPYSIMVLLEGAIRHYNDKTVTGEHVQRLVEWGQNGFTKEVPFHPGRILLQDFTGVPAVVDLAAMRSAVERAGGNPQEINPQVPVDLVVDHSVMVDAYGNAQALGINVDKEFQRNDERYRLLKWAGEAFENFKVVPPSTGIIHQVNLEYLAKSVISKEEDGKIFIYPDSLVGTDSHTTMINGLGVLGWGVGGIEAEAAMLGQPIYISLPEVVGVELQGSIREGVTATDIALSVTQLLRSHGVVGKFVEYYGDGATAMSLADRATIANMAPEYGATMGYFPVDDETIAYLKLTGRDDEHRELVETYYKEVGLFYNPEVTKKYTHDIKVDLSQIVPSLAGPKRPQDRIELQDMEQSFRDVATRSVIDGGFGISVEDLSEVHKSATDETIEIGHGSIVIAAITSCTNTSNPSVMIGAGLIAKKAVELGLQVPSYVKTSLTPGSKVVTEYLKASGLLPYLEKLGFYIAGYGCATCIGNSGPLKPAIESLIEEKDLTVASVLSGNRNFEGRVHPHVKANYLASPMLVVAYALAGHIQLDLAKGVIGKNDQGVEVYLSDLWPSNREIQETIYKHIQPQMFIEKYKDVAHSNDRFNKIEAPIGALYDWDKHSTYIQEPSFFESVVKDEDSFKGIHGATVLALLGDSVTTDHISPAGVISGKSPAGLYLNKNGIDSSSYNSYGSRRGNHEVMMRGTFANIRLRNKLAKGLEGGYTTYFPTDEVVSIYDASEMYRNESKPLVIFAGKEYGTGSSRDWAAKGTYLLGVKAIIAESYERIHRSNLVGMGVLPLEFEAGESFETLGLKGNETYTIESETGLLVPQGKLKVTAYEDDEAVKTFKVNLRLDSEIEKSYYLHGGILQEVLLDKIDK